MPAAGNVVLAINAGSSSIKYAIYRIMAEEETLLYSGTLPVMGKGNRTVHAVALKDMVIKQAGLNTITAIGHRVVHGMARTKPEAITPALIKQLKSLVSYDPEHLPAEIHLIELFLKSFPELLQFACFDTAFHQTMPAVASVLALPRKYLKKGLRRYGFHGLSYQYLTEELSRLNQPTGHPKNVVMAHLGSGASLAAVKDGRSVDTSMGFTPAAGVPMSTRSGDLDPGVAAYLFRQEKHSPQQFDHLVNHESGLMGLSGTSSDIRELLKIRDTDERAAEAIDLFCYQVSKYIGAYAAALGGLDTLIFSGGIGEHMPEIRAQVCHNLGFLGIQLDQGKNLKHADIISTGKVCVRVLPTNEALMMARLITQALTNDI